MCVCVCVCVCVCYVQTLYVSMLSYLGRCAVVEHDKVTNVRLEICAFCLRLAGEHRLYCDFRTCLYIFSDIYIHTTGRGHPSDEIAHFA